MEMTASANTKRSIAEIFDGRSGEYEVSLISARSVLPVLDRTKHNGIKIGIAHKGARLTGQDALAVFEQGQTETLLPASLLPGTSKRNPSLRQYRRDA
jgi:D-alanine-D-alanine ligase